MDYLIPIIAVNSGVKVAVTIALIVRYFDTRERVILLWGLGWLFFSLHSFFELFIVYTGKDIFYFLHHTVWALVAVPFIIATGEEKRSPHLWQFAASLVAIIGITSSYVGVYIISKWYPSIIIPSILNGGGFLLCAFGIKRRSVGSHILFWGFLLNGLHNLDYPFLRNVAGFAPIGFSLCILFALLFAVGFIMLSTEKLKKKIEGSEKMMRENARLYESQRQRIKEMDMIRVITEILISEKEIEKLLGEVAKKSAGIFSAPAISIMLWDERRKNLVIKAGNGLSKDYIRGQKVPREKIDPLPIEPLTTENLQETPFGNLELVKKEGLVSCLSLPLITSDEVIGVLNIYSKGGIRKWTKDEITYGNVIASYIAIAIKNSMLYENLKKNLSELERFHKLAVGRELTMIEMQKKMEEIEKELAKYKS